MRKIISIAKEHKWAIIFALFCTFIIMAPQVYFRFAHKDIYQGVEMMAASDETAYLSRVREVQDGHLSLANPFLKEAKNGPYILPPLGEIIVGYLGKIFFLDIRNTILLSRFIFPFLDFLLIYSFVYLLSKKKLTALVASTGVILGSILLNQRAIFQLIKGVSPRLDFLIFSRPIIPSIHIFLFFGFLTFCWLFLERKTLRWGLLAVLFLGSSFYLYFYTWSFLYVFCGMLCLFFLIQKKWNDIKRMMSVMLGGIVLAIPYFFNLYSVSRNSSYAEMSQRFGFVASRDTVLGLLITPLLIIFLVFFQKQWKERFVFSLALLFTPFIVLNQQIITGRVLINAHYHWYCHTPLAVIFLTIILFELLAKTRKRSLEKIAAFLMICASVYVGVFIQRASYDVREKDAVDSQRYGPVFEWLNKNAGKDQVVFANDNFSPMAAVYTPLNVFYCSPAIYYLGTTGERLQDSLFSSYRLNGLKAEETQQVFSDQRVRISGALYAMYYRETTGGYEGMPEAVLEKLVQEYQGALSIPPEKYYKDLWEKYNVDYAVWDKQNEPQWQLNNFSFLEEAYQNKGLIIYRFNPNAQPKLAQ
ncbi:MAG: hypothetical protein AAB620_00190 [Patescibacteria group bacterium]